MKCIAIDDEQMALEVIKKFCQRIDNIELLTFTNPLIGIEQVKKTKPDILFLDVEMGGVNGVELAHELPSSTFLIFTTAYAGYAVDGFDLNAIDFLHKPFSFGRFEKAVRKVEEQQKLHKLNSLPTDEDKEIIVKVDYKNVNIRILDIIYIESMGNYIKIHLVDSPAILSQQSMKNIEELLPSKNFIRIHKSYIVSSMRIARYNKKQVILYGGTKLPVGRNFTDNITSMENK